MIKTMSTSMALSKWKPSPYEIKKNQMKEMLGMQIFC